VISFIKLITIIMGVAFPAFLIKAIKAEAVLSNRNIYLLDIHYNVVV
jgi:hypothetical protein